MMSKERELLRRVWASERWDMPEDLQADIKELIDQPEQEPVGVVRTIGGYPDDSEHVVDWFCKYKDLKEGDKLYLAPPKREPIDLDQVDNHSKRRL